MQIHPVDRHGLDDVLHTLLAHRLEAEGKLLLYLLGDLAGDVDAARLRDLLQARGYVDPFAIAVVALDDHLAEIDADPHLEALILGNGRVALCEAFLQRHGAFDSVHDAGELCQQTVAHELEDMAMVAGNFGFE